MGEGQVHVVAADERVIADGDAAKREFAGFFGDADQREVGGAAADIADEERIADFEVPPPCSPMSASHA